MTNLLGGPEWTWAMRVSGLYCLVALALVIAPMPAFGHFDAGLTPVVEEMARRSSDPVRIRWFWNGMLLLSPLVFALFSWLAPMLYTLRERPTARLLAVTGAFFLLLLSTCIWLFFFSVDAIEYGKAGRAMRTSTHDPLVLWAVGCFLMNAMIWTAWIALVAVPRAWRKFVR